MPNADLMKALLALLLAAVVAVSLVFAYKQGGRAQDLEWQAAVQKQKHEAEKLLDAEKGKVKGLEADLAKIKTTAEVRDAQAQQTIDRVRAENRRLVAAAGGVLRDPGRRPGGSCPEAQAAGPARVPEAGTPGTELSAEATEFLLELTFEADRAAVYAQSCRQYTLELIERLRAYEAHP